MERLIVMRMVRAIITNDHVGLKTQSESEGRSPPTFLSAFFRRRKKERGVCMGRRGEREKSMEHVHACGRGVGLGGNYRHSMEKYF